VVVTATLVSLALGAVVLGFGRALLYVGSRAGDRPDDAAVSDIGPDPIGVGIRFTVTGRGPHPVLVGASLRRRGLRVRCEGGHFVSVPGRTWRRHLLAARHTLVFVVDAGETQTFVIPVARDTPRRAELIVAVGEPDRLRVVHRAVDCGPWWPRTPAHARPPLPQPS
jgi:hypothetical protein